MNVGRHARGLGGLFALVAVVLAGCVAPLEPEEEVAIDEVGEELMTSSPERTGGDGEGSAGDLDEPAPPVDDMPDPLPWHEAVGAPSGGCDPQTSRSGPDPLPWTPTFGSAGTVGSGSGKD